jgi:anti-sigma factor RsiW
MTATRFTEEELHAYLDGELPAARRPAVAAYLTAHPEIARRLEAYRDDGAAIARIFSRAGDAIAWDRPEPIPSKPTFSAIPWRRAAAIALFVAGASLGLGLFWQNHAANDDLQQFGRQAAVEFELLNDGRSTPAINVPLEKVGQVLSTSLSAPVHFRDPSSSGYRLVGSRMMPATGTPGATRVQLAFRGPDAEVITMYLEARPRAEDAPFRTVNTPANTTVVWIDDELACAISGTLSPDQLEAAGRRIYDAMMS